MIGLIISTENIDSFPMDGLLCKDHKIHLRLDSYDKPMIISGFVNKLAFLVTYTLSGYIMRSYSGEVSSQFTEDSIAWFQKFCPEYIELENELKTRIYTCKGIYILKEYSKLHPNRKVGYIDNGFLPIGCDRTLHSLIFSFQQVYPHIDLLSILFNDNISIYLNETNVIEKDLYTKYRNRAIRKNQKEEIQASVIDLWRDENGNN